MGVSKKKMKIIVTGGSGFLGENLIKRLIPISKKIYVIDKKFDSKKFLEKKIRKIKCDLSNSKTLNKKFRNINKVDFVIHTAAVQPFKKDDTIEKYLKTNLIGSLNLLNICEKKKIKKFIICSSFSVYGRPQKLPIKENHKLQPENTYGFSKMLAEKTFEFFHKRKNFKFIILRFDGIFGKNQNLPGFIKFAISQIKNNKKFDVFSNGNQIRDHLYIDDAVQSILNSIKILKKSQFKIINVGTGQPKTTKQLIKLISYLMRTNPKVRYIKKSNPNFNYNTYMDISKMKKTLKLNPSRIQNSLIKMINDNSI